MSIRGCARGFAGRRWGPVLAVCLLAAACSSPGASDEGDSVRPLDPDEFAEGAADEASGDEEPGGDGEPANPDEGADDPYAVPDEIDAEYLDAVFEAINAVALEARQELIEHGEFTERADEILEALYTGFIASDNRETWAGLLEEGDASAHYAGGPLVMRTERVIEADGDCVVAFTTQDRSELLVDPPDPTRTYTFLLASESSELNPTPWRLGALIQEGAFDEEEGLCEEFLEVLDERFTLEPPQRLL